MLPSSLNRSDPTPLYHQLKSNLELRIALGEFRLGETLPPSEDLCSDYDVSSITVRKAMETLAQEGIIERIPGRGSYVRSIPKLSASPTGSESIFKILLSSPLSEYVQTDFFQEDVRRLLPGFRIKPLNEQQFDSKLEGVNQSDLAMVTDLEFHGLMANNAILRWTQIASPSEQSEIQEGWNQEVRRLFGEKTLEYLLPALLSPVVLFYNATVLKRHGIKEIPAGRSPEAFLDLGEHLRKSFLRSRQKMRHPLLLELGNIRRWALAVYAKGGQLWSQSDGRSLLDTKPVAEAMKLYHEILNQRQIAMNVFESLRGMEQLAFRTGVTAMHFGTYPFLKVYEQLEDFDTGVAPVPLDPDSKTMTVHGTLCIPAKSRHPELAWKVAKLLLSEKHQTQLIANRLHLPTNRNAVASWLDRAATAGQKRSTEIFLRTLSNAVPLEFPPAESAKMLRHLMPLIWLDLANAPARCQELATEINDSMKGQNYTPFPEPEA